MLGLFNVSFLDCLLYSSLISGGILFFCHLFGPIAFLIIVFIVLVSLFIYMLSDAGII